jgi:hypothetical protein
LYNLWVADESVEEYAKKYGYKFVNVYEK